MTAEHAVAERYLGAFNAALERTRTPDRTEIVREIRSHIAEAQAAGRPLDGVLTGLGPADVLARAYAVDSVMTSQGDRALKTIGGFLRVFGIVFASGILTMIVGAALGSVGLAFTLSGVVLFAVGAIEAAGVHLSNVQLAGLSPWAVIAMAPVFFAVGWGALWLLGRYLHALVATLRRGLPGRAAQHPKSPASSSAGR